VHLVEAPEAAERGAGGEDVERKEQPVHGLEAGLADDVKPFSNLLKNAAGV
jgi:hypothetical protein